MKGLRRLGEDMERTRFVGDLRGGGLSACGDAGVMPWGTRRDTGRRGAGWPRHGSGARGAAAEGEHAMRICAPISSATLASAPIPRAMSGSLDWAAGRPKPPCSLGDMSSLTGLSSGAWNCDAMSTSSGCTHKHTARRQKHSPHWHLCGWIERIPGGTQENDGLDVDGNRDYGGLRPRDINRGHCQQEVR